MLNKYGNFILIISGPSGSGKSTIVKKFLQDNDEFMLSVSHTTRVKRKDEIDGVNYYFISKDEFERMIERDEFLEWAKIYDNYYGTSKKEVDRILKSEKNVLLEINVDGLISAKKIFKDDIVSVFVTPENLDELIKRLRDRNTESDDELIRRIREVEREISYIDLYDYLIINKAGMLNESVFALKNIVEAEKLRIKRLKKIKEIFRGGKIWQE